MTQLPHAQSMVKGYCRRVGDTLTQLDRDFQQDEDHAWPAHIWTLSVPLAFGEGTA